MFINGLPQNEEEVLFMGGMYEPKRSKGKHGNINTPV